MNKPLSLPWLQPLQDETTASCSTVLLQCPRCRAPIEDLQCLRCGFALKIRDNIFYALPPERVAHYADFISEYERIRSAEGRGSVSEIFYLSLPYRDITGRNSGQWKIRSRSYEYLLRNVLRDVPRGSTILDMGAGNCWMSYRLSQAGYIPVAVDLLTNPHDGLGAATHFDIHLSSPIPRFQAEATHLPFRDGQFDVIIFNASFHYAENYEETMREALRCLRPGGMVVISDTPLYSKDESGRQMVAERRAAFLQRFGTASDSIKSMEYVTWDRLYALETTLGICWTVHRPWYGLQWMLRPWIARLLGKREPSRFYMYAAVTHG